MKRSALGKAAASSLIIAVTMVGCTGSAFRSSPAAVRQTGDEAKLAAIAEKAIDRHDAARAVQAAEGAVRAAPDNARYRQLLGLAYIAAGRFASAETALTDAMTLGDQEARTIINLSLVQSALGKGELARMLLASHADKVPAADYGLAMAMAGDAQEGVRILSEAIHDPSADARTRQNLAYAYALGGRWKDARLLAGMDLDPLAANQRITQWASTAAPNLAPARIAALMGVAIAAEDAGQPVALALAPAADPVTQPPVEMAAVPLAPAAPADETVIETSVPERTIMADPAPVRVAALNQPFRDNGIEKPHLRTAKASISSAPAASVRKAAWIKPAGDAASNWVVQLGAYDSAAIAREKWTSMARANAVLAGFPVLTSQVTVNGKDYHRLAVKGFASRTDALAMCRSIRARRGQCFVREDGPGATQPQWAVASKGRQFASR